MRGAHCGVFGFGRRAFGLAADDFRDKVVNVVFALFFVRRVFPPDNLPILYDIYAVVSVIAVKLFIRADTYAQAVRPEEVGDDLAKARPAVIVAFRRAEAVFFCRFARSLLRCRGRRSNVGRRLFSCPVLL